MCPAAWLLVVSRYCEVDSQPRSAITSVEGYMNKKTGEFILELAYWLCLINLCGMMQMFAL